MGTALQPAGQPRLRTHPDLADRTVLAIISPANWGRLLEIETDLGVVFPHLECVAPSSLSKLEEAVRASHGRIDMLIAVGGDGTLHQVLQHADLGHQVVGLLPGGTGNDLARTLGFPLELNLRTQHLANLTPVPTDIGTANGVRFHNSGGFGLDTATLRVRDQPHGLFRHSYNLAFAVALLGLRPLRGRIVADGREHSGSFWWVLAMNNRDIGKGTKIAPRAKLDDGLLDLILVREIPRLELLKLLPLAIRGEHINHPAVIYEQAQRIECEMEAVVPNIACDGELYRCGAKTVEFEARPGALRLLR